MSERAAIFGGQFHALKAGASGFLLKDATREQLTGAVRAVAAGETSSPRPSPGG